ncbi:IS66 family insertion sequence element accessory protein TnpB [Sorangium sp. So ce1097]|uniref:IS66 family insertion sequence element accessory protein TnpB n=1 Tax=Sorangium sp. So ce1097 TaxID=3133330 RepID=UPI003F61CF9E
MLTLPPSVRVYVAAEPADLRKSFDGLSSLVTQRFGTDPLCGHLFVFRNRRGDQIRVLFWDRTGYAIFANHLSSHYTSFAFRRGRWLRLRDARAAAARSLRRSQRLLCFVG